MKLIDWLNKKGMSPAAFADLVGYDRSTVGRWLDNDGPTIPRREARAKIREVTGGEVMPGDFMDDDDVGFDVAGESLSGFKALSL